MIQLAVWIIRRRGPVYISFLMSNLRCTHIRRNQMTMHIEYACEKCGNSTVKSDPVPLNPLQTPLPANKCDSCGHVTEVFRVARFQWTPHLRSVVGHVLSQEEILALRLDPINAVSGWLNTNLIAAGKAGVEIDLTSRPITIREKS